MTTPLTFSIVMPSYNQKDYIEEAINSILSQSGEFYIDLIINDGGSTDGALEIIKSINKKLIENCKQKKIKKLTYFIDSDHKIIKCLGLSFRYQSKPDKGFSDAINQGIQSAEGDIFSYLNTDDYLLDNALNTVSNQFLYPDNQDIDVIYGEAWDVDVNGKHIARYNTQDVNIHKLADANCMSQPSVFVTLDMVRKAGGFSETVKNSIDYEYWLRLESLGARFLFIPEYLSSTRIHGGSKTLRNRNQIVIETLAIQSYYGGNIWNSDTEFIWGMSVVGRYTNLLFKGPLRFIRSSILKLLNCIWLFFNIGKLRRYGVRLIEG
jgi:glycosyltransferase involved in cell wall biosynthesis